ncbi:MAG TPA: helix-turn-helix domain-containing protein [Burkholderiales bacterium]|nr:helix-turn-helix domain-containing protein [Burkholderiales bacterium]
MDRPGVVKSAGRVLEILELFARMKSPLSVRQMAEHLDYPLSSAAALVKSLESKGYLTYEQGLRAYLPTVRTARLGEWVYDSLAHKQGLIHLLMELADRTGHTAVLAARNDVFADYIHVVPGQYELQLNVPQGTRRLLCKSGLGWAILAGHPDPAIRDVVIRTRSMLGRAAQPITYDWLMVNIREARIRGYALSRSLVLKDVGMAAMALPPMPDGSHLAIGVGGYVRQIEKDLDDIVGAMNDCLRNSKAARKHPVGASTKGV